MTIYEIFFITLIVVILLILIFRNRTPNKPPRSILKQPSPQQTPVKKHVNFPDLRKSQMTSTVPVQKNQTPSNELSTMYSDSSIEWRSDINDTPSIYEGRAQNPPLRFNI